MSRTVVLDSVPLGLLTHRRGKPEADEYRQWLQTLVVQGCRIVVPEIVDYEVRRELLRANKTFGIARLDAFIPTFDYLAINTAAMRKAAELWAQARKSGRPTAPDPALDADAILAAQAITLGEADMVIATTNVGHLRRFVAAERWRDIK